MTFDPDLSEERCISVSKAFLEKELFELRSKEPGRVKANQERGEHLTSREEHAQKWMPPPR